MKLFTWHMLHWARARHPYSEVEEKIKPLVETMNRSGVIQTIASCQGHVWGSKPPYVYFKTSPDIAAVIEQALRKLEANSQSPIAQWSIWALFNEQCELTYLLHSPEYHRRSYRLLDTIWLLGIRRQRLDSDLLILSWYIEQTVGLILRVPNEAKV